MMHSHREFSRLVHALGEESFGDDELRHAAWAARCAGRGDAAPLRPEDLDTIADRIQLTTLPAGSVVFAAGEPAQGVWTVRDGQLELTAGSGPEPAVVDILRPGDTDGDIALLLDLAPSYTARTLCDAECLFLSSADFDAVLGGHPTLARRWLANVIERVSATQSRLVRIVGQPLSTQLARLLLDEAVRGCVQLPQRTLAAMLGVQRPSLNKILKEFERDELISAGHGTITLADADALRRIAGTGESPRASLA
ncbi:Crp/Fnr family transcriptional regulator [Nocardia halotolerans]|uniref:Crp/Fnr family transcriptional regulator n=1 Tax=Nocardia halotolerans TaxID=1755878 RepID=A0ABV8VFQ7_9NOCA